MVYCNNCGTAVDETRERFCNNCGTPIQVPQAAQASFNGQGGTPNSGYAAGQYQDSQPNPQYQYNTYSQYGNSYGSTYPMKWYKFLIYFALIAGAIYNFVYGFMFMTGAIYEVQSDVPAEFIYGVLGNGLKTLDVFFGIASIVLAVFAFIVRNKLANFKKDGPKSYYIYVGAAIIISVIYIIGLSGIVGSNGVELETGSMIGSVIGQGVELYLTYIYFNKRASLFVN